MPVRMITPYLIFNGQAEKAVELYKRTLGAQVLNLMRYGETPGMQVPPEYKSRIIHAMLQIGAAQVMVSDAHPGATVPEVSNLHVMVDFTDPDEMLRCFDALSAGGKVTQAPNDTFWGAKFGMLTDAFGVGWMFNCLHKQP